MSQQSLYTSAKKEAPRGHRPSGAELPYKTVYNQSPDGLVVLDFNDQIVDANKSALKIFQRALAELKGSGFSRHLGWTSRKRFARAVEEAKAGRPASAIDINVLDPEKNLVPVEVTVSLFSNSGGPATHILASMRDVAERRKILQEAHEEEKMQALQHFIAGAAHEIHHPIKALLDQSRRLVQKYSRREFEYVSYREFRDIMDSLEKMQEQIRYCHETTQRMISLNKKRIGKLSAHAKVNAVIERKIMAIRHQFELTNITFRFRQGRDLKLAAIFEQDLEQILQNILSNSVQSMPAGGVIQIKTVMDAKGRNVVIECKDTGVGIPTEAIPRVFEPFFTTKQRGMERNSGLGLTIVYSIIKSYHGHIAIKSTLRQGTVVTISLPVYHQPKSKPAK